LKTFAALLLNCKRLKQKESEKRYRLLFEKNVAGVYRSNVAGKLLECNTSFATMLGYDSPEEILEYETWDLYRDTQQRKRFLKKLKAHRTLTNFEECLYKKDGTPVWILENVSLDENGILQGTLIDITERKRAEMQLQKLFETSRLINSTMDIDKTFEFVDQAVNELVGFDYFIIFFVSHDKERIYVAYASENIRNKIEGASIEYGEGIVGFSIENKEILVVGNAPRDNRRKKLAGTEKCISQIVVPLIIEGEPAGALHISKAVEYAYTQADVNVLKPLSEVISSAIYNSKLHEGIKETSVELERRITERSRRLEILLNARQKLQKERTWERGLKTIVESINDLGLDAVGVFLVDRLRKKLVFHYGMGMGTGLPERGTSVSLKNDEYYGVKCVLEKRTIFVQDAKAYNGKQFKETPSFVWVPVMVQNEVFAALSAGNMENELTEEDVKDLEILASMCGAFIDRTRMLIEPVAEKKLKTEINYWLEPMEGYIVLEKKPEKSYKIFVDLVSHGIPGFVVSREYPEKLRRKYGLVRTPVLWMSRIEVQDAMSPEDLPKLQYIVEDFTRKSEESVILLDGLEYLITQLSFESILKHLEELKDMIALHNSRLIIPLHKGTLSEKEFSMLTREFTLLD
jgi:PAS domain S-box-containing protein